MIILTFCHNRLFKRFWAKCCGLFLHYFYLAIAVDAYVNFARRTSWREAASSSLTELFAPQIHQSRLESWPKHYPWIKEEGYTYFRSRLSQARRDVEHGLTITLDSFKTTQEQERMLEILQFKLDILWTILDALSLAYVHDQAPYQSVTTDHVWHKGLFK